MSSVVSFSSPSWDFSIYMDFNTIIIAPFSLSPLSTVIWDMTSSAEFLGGTSWLPLVNCSWIPLSRCSHYRALVIIGASHYYHWEHPPDHPWRSSFIAGVLSMIITLFWTLVSISRPIIATVCPLELGITLATVIIVANVLTEMIAPAWWTFGRNGPLSLVEATVSKSLITPEYFKTKDIYRITRGQSSKLPDRHPINAKISGIALGGRQTTD